MHILAEQERLATVMRDIDAWNSLTVEERATWLHRDLWGPFNQVASMLTPAQVETLRTHPDFKAAREAFTVAIHTNSTVDHIRRATDLFFEAVRRL